MSALLTIAVLSLMVPLRLQTHFVLLRPFEFLIVLGIVAWPLAAMRRGVRVPDGLLLLLPYFLWHVASAVSGGLHNAAREASQVIAVTIFAFLLAQEASRLDIQRTSRRLLWGMAAIAAGTILWHIDHGYWVGWKRVTDPRLVFVFLPALVAGLILFSEEGKRRKLFLVWIGLFPLLLMSGERKALVIYLILTALLFARGRVALIAPALAAGFAVLFVLSTMVANPYLQKQMHTLVDPSGTGNYKYVIATGHYLPGDTPSDVQRAFAFHISRQLFAGHPLFGIGTNQYVQVLNQTFPDLPKDLRLGIHGEFQRILTENGLIGLALYLLIWAHAWVRLSSLLRHALREGLLTRTQARVLPLLFFIPFALFLGTEAPGTRAFVGVIIVSLLPDLAQGALARAREPATVQPGRARPRLPALHAPARPS
jgi:hypothetical protein